MVPVRSNQGLFLDDLIEINACDKQPEKDDGQDDVEQKPQEDRPTHGCGSFAKDRG